MSLIDQPAPCRGSTEIQTEQCWTRTSLARRWRKLSRMYMPLPERTQPCHCFLHGTHPMPKPTPHDSQKCHLFFFVIIPS
ncbi:hypothetical protein VTJ04DRAFT_3528 [Mycothermus thermophilus]|uniref:uncharacterized protein n=1 Tax=Humicola insolens TaxID=85995 RepID=UPI0037439C9D